MITVALPNYASDIAWLAMESLTRQQTDCEWELIVYEDSDRPLGKDFFLSYFDRLKKVGCKRIEYFYSSERVPLNKKWITMAEASDKDSLGIMLQGSDDYSFSKRIKMTWIAFRMFADWLDFKSAYFYNIRTKKMMYFEAPEDLTGVNIAISKKAMLQMPKDEDKWQGVDSWLFKNMPEGFNHIQISEPVDGVFTDGFNRISLSRRKIYTNPTPPFYKTNKRLDELIPQEIIELL